MGFIRGFLRVLFGKSFLDSVKFMTTEHRGRVLLSLLLIGAGLVWGFLSKQVHFLQAGPIQGKSIITEDMNTYYLPAPEPDTYYIVRGAMLTPSPRETKFIDMEQLVSLTYSDDRYDDSVTITNENKTTERRTIKVYPVVEITFTTIEKKTYTLTSAAYRLNATGQYINNWYPWGVSGVGAGMLLLIGTSLHRRFTTKRMPQPKPDLSARLATIPD